MVNRVMRKSFYITLILAGILVPVANAYADGDTTDFSITVNPSLNLSVSKAVSGFSVTPSKNGSYDSDSFNVISSTNNATGYTLTMSVDDTDLVSETINVNTGDPLTVPTLTKTQDGITAAQFEASTDSGVLNHYGISIAGANYNAMESPKTILETSENNTTSDVTAISLAAKLDLLTVPAVYSTTINFQMVANALPSVIPYINDDPDPDVSTNHPCAKMGGVECEDTDDDGQPDSLVFHDNSLLRAYEIAYTNAGIPMYIETPKTAQNTIGWRPMTNEDLATIGGKEVRFAIQDIQMTLSDNANSDKVCEAASPSLVDASYVDEAPVVDLRDGKTYWIAKLADGKCWMTQNLDFDIIGPITSELSDLNIQGSYAYTANDGYSVGANNEIIWTPSEHTFDGKTGWNTTGSDRSPYSMNVGDYYYNDNHVQCTGAGYNSIDDCAGFGTTITNLTVGTHGHIGNYYSWAATIASNGDTNFSVFGSSATPQNSICPKGWMVPSHSNDVLDFSGLYQVYGAYAGETEQSLPWVLTGRPVYFTLAGSVSSNVLGGLDSYNYYATSYGGIGQYGDLAIQASQNPFSGNIGFDNSGLYIGTVVRCRAR